MVELNHPELLKRCIRCKDSSGTFNTQSIAKTVGSEIVQTFEINFSVCNGCEAEINKIFETEKNFNVYRKLLIFILIISIIAIWAVTANIKRANILDFIMAIVGTVISFLGVIYFYLIHNLL